MSLLRDHFERPSPSALAIWRESVRRRIESVTAAAPSSASPALRREREFQAVAMAAGLRHALRLAEGPGTSVAVMESYLFSGKTRADRLALNLLRDARRIARTVGHLDPEVLP